MTLPFTTRNDDLFGELNSYIITTPSNAAYINTTPFGWPITHHINPLHTASETFLQVLQTLDGLTFGPEGMPMDKWVFYNCAELPGFIYGFCIESHKLTTDERSLLQLPLTYHGPVPVSMYIAIPMWHHRSWFGHNLASLNRVFPARGWSQLGTITKALALKAFGCQHFVGATQWTSNALHIHTRFGPLKLQTTYTPAHSMPQTLTYTTDISDESLRAVLGDPLATISYPESNDCIAADDEKKMKRLQKEIERGAEVVITGPPSIRSGGIVHPLRVS